MTCPRSARGLKQLLSAPRRSKNAVAQFVRRADGRRFKDQARKPSRRRLTAPPRSICALSPGAPRRRLRLRLNHIVDHCSTRLRGKPPPQRLIANDDARQLMTEKAPEHDLADLGHLGTTTQGVCPFGGLMMPLMQTRQTVVTITGDLLGRHDRPILSKSLLKPLDHEPAPSAPSESRLWIGSCRRAPCDRTASSCGRRPDGEETKALNEDLVRNLEQFAIRRRLPPAPTAAWQSSRRRGRATRMALGILLVVDCGPSIRRARFGTPGTLKRSDRSRRSSGRSQRPPCRSA